MYRFLQSLAFGAVELEIVPLCNCDCNNNVVSYAPHYAKGVFHLRQLTFSQTVLDVFLKYMYIYVYIVFYCIYMYSIYKHFKVYMYMSYTMHDVHVQCTCTCQHHLGLLPTYSGNCYRQTHV